MAKAKVSAAKQSLEITTDSQPRPTQPAFEPAAKEHFWGGFIAGVTCLIGAGFGLGAWLDPSIAATLESADRSGQTSVWWLPFIFPLLIPIALYFLWTTWQWWHKTRTFEHHKQTTIGTITHLWFEHSSGRGKQHYVGYRFGEGGEAYQKVHSRTYSRLVVGDAVTVEYVPNRFDLSRVDWHKRD